MSTKNSSECTWYSPWTQGHMYRYPWQDDSQLRWHSYKSACNPLHRIQADRTHYSKALSIPQSRCIHQKAGGSYNIMRKKYGTMTGRKRVRWSLSSKSINTSFLSRIKVWSPRQKPFIHLRVYVLVSDRWGVPFLLRSVMTSMADAQLLPESEH